MKLPETMRFTGDLEEAVTGKEVLIMAVPSTAVTRSTAAKIRPYLTKGQIVVDVAKGIEETYTDDFEPAD